MNIVALETSSQPGGLALLDGGRVVYETRLPDSRRTTEMFAVQLQLALRQVGWRPADVELFAVCEGPGSFTGLRIGVTAAKTFAYATGCDLVAINTLEVIAFQASVESGPVWAVLDAQRQQLFVAAYEAQTGPLREVVPTQIVDARPWISSLPAETVVTGEGLRAWRSLIPDQVSVVAETRWSVHAASLGQLAAEHYQVGQSADLWKLVPRYYRPSAAEEKHRR